MQEPAVKAISFEISTVFPKESVPKALFSQPNTHGMDQPHPATPNCLEDATAASPALRPCEHIFLGVALGSWEEGGSGMSVPP
jgi:hypothetical protein